MGARLHVDIALARKRVIEQLREACSGFSILGVGAAPKTDGDAEFIFEERAPARLDAKSVFLSGPALLAFALLALFISFDIHIARRASFMRAREAAVVEELHAARASAALFEGLPSEAERRGSARLPDIAQQTRATLENLPSGALIERVRFSNGIVTVNGFAPHIDAMPQTARGSIARSPSDRPDYDRIEYSLDRDEARESSE